MKEHKPATETSRSSSRELGNKTPIGKIVTKQQGCSEVLEGNGIESYPKQSERTGISPEEVEGTMEQKKETRRG